MVLTVLWLWAGSAVSGSVVGYQPPNVGAGPLSPSTSNSDVEHSNHGGYSPPKLPSQQQQQQQQEQKGLDNDVIEEGDELDDGLDDTSV